MSAPNWPDWQHGLKRDGIAHSAGLERLFEMTAAAIDGHVPQGQNWHQVLLDQMVAEVPSVRPALISEETRQMLDEYRGFRHIVRNVYAFRFDLANVQKLVQEMPSVFSQVRAELLAFADFLEQQAPVDGQSR